MKKKRLHLKKNKIASSTKSSRHSSSKDTPFKFSTEQTLHLVSESAHGVTLESFKTWAALADRAEQLIIEARSGNAVLSLSVFEGFRCPVSRGVIPKVMSKDGTWRALVSDPAADIDDCPPDGVIVGSASGGELRQESDLDYLDSEVVGDDEDGEELSETIQSPAGVTEQQDRVLQIFDQARDES